MKVLVACEESQEVCKAFREKGHEAYSCDIQECSGGHPEWHIQSDVLPLLNGNCEFKTIDGQKHGIDGKWDLLIAHPPCTYMSNAGACRMYPHKGQIDPERFEKAMLAKAFFMAFYDADCDHIAIENPRPLRCVELPKESQRIQPWQFGHPYTKLTYLWLKGLPQLSATEICEERHPYICGNADIWKKQAAKGKVWGKEKSAKHRSKTFPGIAKAMANQWAEPQESEVTEWKDA
jgi:hypothetical protein